MISALQTRIESEKKELEELFDEKHRKELEVVSELIADTGLATEEVAAVLQQYIDSRTANAS